MNVTHGTLLSDFPGVRFAVVRIDGEWRARAVRPNGLGTVEAKSATPLDAIRRVVRGIEPVQVRL